MDKLLYRLIRFVSASIAIFSASTVQASPSTYQCSVEQYVDLNALRTSSPILTMGDPVADLDDRSPSKPDFWARQMVGQHFTVDMRTGLTLGSVVSNNEAFKRSVIRDAEVFEVVSQWTYGVTDLRIYRFSTGDIKPFVLLGDNILSGKCHPL